MDRRRYLGLLAAGVVAGCSGNTDSPTTSSVTNSTTATPSPTPTPTPTATPEPASFEIDWQTPSRVAVGETYRIRFTVRNTGGQTGTFTSVLQSRIEGSSWTDGRRFDRTLEPGESWTYRSETTTPQRAGEPEFRLEGYTDIRTVEIYYESTAPEVTTVNLVSEWDDFGDVRDNAISSASVGDQILIAYQHETFVHEGTFHIFKECEVYEVDTGDRVDIQSGEDEQVTQGNGYQVWEGAFVFYTRGWDSGEYRAEVQIRDEVTSEVSNVETTTFELTA